MEIKIIQPPQKNLQAQAYDDSTLIASVINENTFYSHIFVIKTSSSSGKEYKQFQIVYSGDGTMARTTNYYKAIGLAVAGKK